ncbi:MAG TPA: nucleoside phosphorylase [Anaerolineaceae bacterium]|nr:nucleoside phosphorylase [Anaerolineaceae bacterium]
MDHLELPFDPEDYPILHFDPNAGALLNPADVCPEINLPKHVVMCFFREVIEKIVKENDAKLLFTSKSECSDHPFYEIDYHGKRVAFFTPGVGAPLAAGLMDEAIQMGGEHFIAVGGCGVLEKEIATGQVLVPVTAIRGEGVSYHYLPATHEINMNFRPQMAIEMTLKAHNVPFYRVKTWTTDAFFRETPAKVAHYREQGAKVVEMEASAFMAVAEFRGVDFGQILYGGDLVHPDGWDQRAWNHKHDVRESLFWLAVEACLAL